MIRFLSRKRSNAAIHPPLTISLQRTSKRRLEIIFLAGICIAGAFGRSAHAFGDPEAESLYGKMAEQIRTAKTVQITCQGSFKTPGFEADVKATLLLKEGNKMRLELETNGWRDGEPYAYGFRMISDGSKIRMSERKQAWQEFKSNSQWNENIAANITRGGFPSGLELARVKQQGQPQDAVIGFRPVAVPTEFVLWSKEKLNGKEVLPIEFKAKNESEFQKDTSTILWLAAANGLPAKRMIVVRTDRTLTVTENYEKFLLNEPIEGSAFAFPKEE